MTDERPVRLDIQALVDGINANKQSERATTQLTLGALIAALEMMPANAQVANLRRPNSYRGYYSDLYFERHDGTRTATELLTECKGAMGQVFLGYKGGEFVMNASATKRFFNQLVPMNHALSSNRFTNQRTTNVGDITVNVNAGKDSSQTALTIGQELRKEIRRGTFSF